MLGVSINQLQDTSIFFLPVSHLKAFRSSYPRGILLLEDFPLLKIKKESVSHTFFSKKIHPTKRGLHSV
jgi:hypothetical protein